MERNGFYNNSLLLLLVTYMIVADFGSASLLLKIPKSFLTIHQMDSSPATQITAPKPRPASVENNNSKSTSPIESDNTTSPRLANNSSNMDSHPSINITSNNTTIVDSSNSTTPTNKQIEKGKNHKTTDITNNSVFNTTESCERVPRSCRLKDTMVACITTFQGSKEVAVVVQNKGDKAVKVNLTVPTSIDAPLLVFEIPNRQSKEIKIPAAVDLSSRIVLKAETGECVLYMNLPKTGGKFSEQLSFYSKQVTPIYGAYLLLVVALVFGGTWAFCKLKKKRSEGGATYQELEMGMAETDTAVNAETAEAWDGNWDDDWDEDNSVKLSDDRNVGSISANGLSSRSSKKDGWDVDWDD